MLLTHHTNTRTYTYVVSDDGLSFGAAICHTVNGETGEILNEYSPRIGSLMARQRLRDNPINISGTVVEQVFSDAIRAGHRVTLRDLLLRIVRDVPTDLINEVYDGDNAFTNAVNVMLAEEAEKIREEEAAAWADWQASQEPDLSDDEWYDEMLEENYDDVDFLAYIDYSDRY